MTRLSDNDWRVLAGVQLGAVRRTIRESQRGVLVEYFTMGDEDVTQSITRLQRAGKITTVFPMGPVTNDAIELIVRRFYNTMKKLKI